MNLDGQEVARLFQGPEGQKLIDDKYHCGAFNRLFLPEQSHDLGQALVAGVAEVRRRVAALALDATRQADVARARQQLDILSCVLDQIVSKPPVPREKGKVIGEAKVTTVYNFEMEGANIPVAARTFGKKVGKIVLIVEVSNPSDPSCRLVFLDEKCNIQPGEELFGLAIKYNQKNSFPSLVFSKGSALGAVLDHDVFHLKDILPRESVYRGKDGRVPLTGCFRETAERLKARAAGRKEGPVAVGVPAEAAKQVEKKDLAGLMEDLERDVMDLVRVYQEGYRLTEEERGSFRFWAATMQTAETERLQYRELYKGDQQACRLIESAFCLFGVVDSQMGSWSKSPERQAYMEIRDRINQRVNQKIDAKVPVIFFSTSEINTLRQNCLGDFHDVPHIGEIIDLLLGPKKGAVGKFAVCFSHYFEENETFLSYADLVSTYGVPQTRYTRSDYLNRWWLMQYGDLVLEMVPADYLLKRADLASAEKLIAGFQDMAYGFYEELFKFSLMSSEESVVAANFRRAEQAIHLQAALRNLGFKTKTAVTDADFGIDVQVSLNGRKPDDVSKGLLGDGGSAYIQFMPAVDVAADEQKLLGKNLPVRLIPLPSPIVPGSPGLDIFIQKAAAKKAAPIAAVALAPDFIRGHNSQPGLTEELFYKGYRYPHLPFPSAGGQQQIEKQLAELASTQRVEPQPEILPGYLKELIGPKQGQFAGIAEAQAALATIEENFREWSTAGGITNGMQIHLTEEQLQVELPIIFKEAVRLVRKRAAGHVRRDVYKKDTSEDTSNVNRKDKDIQFGTIDEDERYAMRRLREEVRSAEKGVDVPDEVRPDFAEEEVDENGVPVLEQEDNVGPIANACILIVRRWRELEGLFVSLEARDAFLQGKEMTMADLVVQAGGLLESGEAATLEEAFSQITGLEVNIATETQPQKKKKVASGKNTAAASAVDVVKLDEQLQEIARLEMQALIIAYGLGKNFLTEKGLTLDGLLAEVEQVIAEGEAGGQAVTKTEALRRIAGIDIDDWLERSRLAQVDYGKIKKRIGEEYPDLQQQFGK